MPDDRERCLAVGMTDDVTKSIDPQALEAAIARHCLPARGAREADRLKPIRFET
jgi:CheY-like chemotaxis protein